MGGRGGRWCTTPRASAAMSKPSCARGPAAWMRSFSPRPTAPASTATFEGRSLEAVIALAAAMHGTRELALESAAQGRALLTTLRQAWPAPELDELEALCRRLEVEPRHACVAGVAAAAHEVPLGAATPRLPARARRQPDLGRHPPDPPRPDRRAASYRGARSRRSSGSWKRRSPPPSTTSAARRRWSTGARWRHETQRTRLFRS